jgi:CRISPR-associated protein Cas2
MTVLILERVPISLRGQLTRWMIEVKAGVFVGKTSALVREKLWERACKYSKGGGCVLVHNARTEQGFDLRLYGRCSREVVDMEGLKLIRVPAAVEEQDVR